MFYFKIDAVLIIGEIIIYSKYVCGLVLNVVIICRAFKILYHLVFNSDTHDDSIENYFKFG